MQTPYEEGHCPRWHHGGANAVLQPADFGTDLTRETFNIDEVLRLPEPMPKAYDKFRDRLGYAVLDALPEVIGCRWDAVAEAAIRTLRPSAIRLAPVGVKLASDAVWWRVTVYLEDSVILRVCQEVKVILPNSCQNGRMLKVALGYKDSKYEAKQKELKDRE